MQINSNAQLHRMTTACNFASNDLNFDVQRTHFNIDTLDKNSIKVEGRLTEKVFNDKTENDKSKNKPSSRDFFCPCPIPSCGRIYGRGDGIQKHFLQLHVDESWNDWMSERRKYYRKDFAQEPNALFV